MIAVMGVGGTLRREALAVLQVMLPAFGCRTLDGIQLHAIPAKRGLDGGVQVLGDGMLQRPGLREVVALMVRKLPLDLTCGNGKKSK